MKYSFSSEIWILLWTQSEKNPKKSEGLASLLILLFKSHQEIRQRFLSSAFLWYEIHAFLQDGPKVKFRFASPWRYVLIGQCMLPISIQMSLAIPHSKNKSASDKKINWPFSVAKRISTKDYLAKSFKRHFLGFLIHCVEQHMLDQSKNFFVCQLRLLLYRMNAPETQEKKTSHFFAKTAPKLGR